MKIKEVLILSILLTLSLFSRAQYNSVMAEDMTLSGDGYTTVRNLSNTEVITYIRTNEIHRFTYENNSTLYYNYIDLPIAFDKIRVYDFKIVNDVLYFCGEDFGSGMGILGTFDASVLRGPIATGVPIDYFEVSNTKVLTRLDAYKDLFTGDTRLTSIGLCGTCGCGVWACGRMVDCAGFSPGVPPASVSVHNAYFGGGNDVEQWFDVVSTDDWVVLVGYGYISGQSGLMLRRFPKSNPMDPEIDNMYFFEIADPVAQEEIRAVSLKENDIAVVYRGEQIQNTTDYTHFRIFDISSMININSQEYVVYYKSYLWEMAYMDRANRVVVLDNFAPLSTPPLPFQSNFVHLIPYQFMPYSTDIAYDKAWMFRSITNLDGNFFVGAGYFHFLLRDATASYPASGCPENNEMKILIIDNFEPDIFPLPLAVSFPPVALNNEFPLVQQNPLNLICTD